MRTNRRAVIFSALFCALGASGLSFVLSLKAAPPKDAVARKNVPSKNADKNASKKADATMSGVSTGITATLPDPKRPGKLLYELRAANGNAQSDASGTHGDLDSVWARLYQNGVPSAVLTAPHARGGSAGKSVTITGTGGVVVKSLSEPGTKLTADTVVWYAGQSKIVATGHVFYHNGKTQATLTGQQATGYTQLKSMIITGGGHGTMTF